jgi:hypothetical protein
MVENGPMQLGFNNPSYYTHTWYFYQPWTSAGLQPAGANNSQFKIFEIFPNPSDRFITIKFLDQLSNARVIILSTDGYIVHQEEVNQTDSLLIDVSKFNRATYYVRLVNDKLYSNPLKIVLH